ncbi:hypothetical protein MASR1M50_19330 [Burkholderiales bacterium]
MHIEEPLRAGAVHGAALWDTCLDALARELPEQQFNTWIKPLSAQLSADPARLTLYVGNRFKLDWVRAQYATRIAALLESLHGQPVALELALAPRASTCQIVIFRSCRGCTTEHTGNRPGA